MIFMLKDIYANYDIYDDFMIPTHKENQISPKTPEWQNGVGTFYRGKFYTKIFHRHEIS